MKALDQDWVPSTMVEAVDAFYESLDDADKRYICKTEDFVQVTHHSIGQAIRNTWSLWETDTPLKRDFIHETGLWGHGDDVSGYLITQVVRRVRGQSEDLTDQVDEMKAHWVKEGTNPATGKQLGDSSVG
jgi:hypothetical protein